MTVRNSIIAGNTGGNCGGSVHSQAGNFNNLVDDGTCGDYPYFTNRSDILLGALGSYGGSTQTVPLLPGSYAIGRGRTGYCPAADQRGSAARGHLRCRRVRVAGLHARQPHRRLAERGRRHGLRDPLGLTVTPVAAGEPVDGGLVTFTAPASGASTNPIVNVATIASGAASQPVTANSVVGGPYVVNASAAGASGAATYTLVNTLGSATVTLTSSPNPSNYRQKVTFNATVTGAAGTPTGTVTFYENPSGDAAARTEAKQGDAVGAEGSSNVVTLVDGVAVFRTSSLLTGIHSMVAVYSGDAVYLGSTSNIVDQIVNGALAIVEQPANQAVVAGQPATFTAAAVGYPTPTVQWQVSTAGGSWSDIPDATATTLTLDNVQPAQNGSQYRAVFSSGGASVTTQAATLTVYWPPVITQEPADLTVNAGATATFSAAASANPAATVRWQFSADGNEPWSDIDGATEATLTFIASIAQNGYQFRAIFSNALDGSPLGSAMTRAAVLTVVSTPAAASIAGTVFNDANGDGQPAGESGLAGVTVELRHTDDSLIATATTGADGAYAFIGLGAGDYRVRLALPAGYRQTTADPADISLAEAQAVTGIDFGAVFPADLRVAMTYTINGKQIIYTITVTNDGPAEAVAAALNDPLPSGTAFVSVMSTAGNCTGGKTVTCNFGTLANGGTANITLKVNRTNNKIDIVNTATVAAATFDPDPSDNTATVTVPKP